MAEYNGWRNQATWNVALYIQNEEALYQAAKLFRHLRYPYGPFVRYLSARGKVRTPDGVSYASSRLCRTELNELIRSL